MFPMLHEFLSQSESFPDPVKTCILNVYKYKLLNGYKYQNNVYYKRVHVQVVYLYVYLA